MQLPADYQSFYNLQYELNKLGKVLHCKIAIPNLIEGSRKHSGESTIINTTWFSIVEHKNQLRYLSKESPGERRINDISYPYLNILSFYITDKK